MAKKAQFYIRRTKNKEFRPYLKAANGEKVAGTETYKTRGGAMKWIHNLAAWVIDASTEPIAEE